MTNAVLELQLWEKVQEAHPDRAVIALAMTEYAKALAEFDRAANAPPVTNVIHSDRFGGAK